jgi:hypothetical protein
MPALPPVNTDLLPSHLPYDEVFFCSSVLPCIRPFYLLVCWGLGGETVLCTLWWNLEAAAFWGTGCAWYTWTHGVSVFVCACAWSDPAPLFHLGVHDASFASGLSCQWPVSRVGSKPGYLLPQQAFPKTSPPCHSTWRKLKPLSCHLSFCSAISSVSFAPAQGALRETAIHCLP